MDNDIRTLLDDMHNAINEIDSFFVNIALEFAVYKRDVKTKELLKGTLK